MGENDENENESRVRSGEREKHFGSGLKGSSARHPTSLLANDNIPLRRYTLLSKQMAPAFEQKR